MPEAYRDPATATTFISVCVIEYGKMAPPEPSLQTLPEALCRTPQTPEDRLIESGHRLPSLPVPGGNYLPAKTVGTLVYLAGVISAGENGIVPAAPAGEPPSIEAGYLAAQACALTQLAVLRQHLGSLSAVKSIVSVNGYVAAPAGFPDSPKIINGASDLLVQVFGEAGKHVRAAIAVSSLPRNALVELQMIVEIAGSKAPLEDGRTPLPQP